MDKKIRKKKYLDIFASDFSFFLVRERAFLKVQVPFGPLRPQK